LLLAFGCAAQAEHADRVVVDGVFISPSTPELRLKVDGRFEYLGAASFTLKEIANVERHHWAVTGEDGIVTAMVILQFEGLLEGIDGAYRFSIPEGPGQAGSNFRFSPARIKLGKDEFVHNTWAFDNGESIRENPGSEPAHTSRLLAENRFHLADELIMSRFVTEVGEAGRDELIVFYMEPLSAHGNTLQDFPDGGPPNDTFDSLSALMKERSLNAITWLPDIPPQ